MEAGDFSVTFESVVRGTYISKNAPKFKVCFKQK